MNFFRVVLLEELGIPWKIPSGLKECERPFSFNEKSKERKSNLCLYSATTLASTDCGPAPNKRTRKSCLPRVSEPHSYGHTVNTERGVLAMKTPLAALSRPVRLPSTSRSLCRACAASAAPARGAAAPRNERAPGAEPAPPPPRRAPPPPAPRPSPGAAPRALSPPAPQRARPAPVPLSAHAAAAAPEEQDTK